jgi:hypothetical protein
MDELDEECNRLHNELNEVKAARLSYARLLGCEVGDIHEVISRLLARTSELERKASSYDNDMKAAQDRLYEAEEYIRSQGDDRF